MDKRTRSLVLSRSMELIDELVLACSKNSEDATRRAIRDEVIKKADATDDRIEKLALIRAHKHLESLSYYDILEMHECLSTDDEFDPEYQESLEQRIEILQSEPGNRLLFYDEKTNQKQAYRVVLNFIHEEEYCFLLIDLNEYPDSEDASKAEFYRYVMEEDPYYDHFEKITDTNLLKTLTERAEKIQKRYSDD